MPREARIGIVGGGLMGREAASSLARWLHLLDHPVQPILAGVADPSPAARSWFDSHGIPTFERTEELLPHCEIVYAAVPHHLHEEVYTQILGAGKDLFAEKPFGIDEPAARRIAERAQGRFVRVSSEFPFYPAAQRIYKMGREGAFGHVIEVASEFNHSSDLDPKKPINWKRQVAFCGEYGCLGDLGMHVCHLPFRLGLRPAEVHARLVQIFPERPDGKGGMAPCETWDNGLLDTVTAEGTPVGFATRRVSPGDTNTWRVCVLGTQASAEFSTDRPKTLSTLPYEPGQPQAWREEATGQGSVWPVVTGHIFEFGFSDAVQQMWAAFLAEWAGAEVSFGCATVEEALLSHRLFTAALQSQAERSVVRL